MSKKTPLPKVLLLLYNVKGGYLFELSVLTFMWLYHFVKEDCIKRVLLNLPIRNIDLLCVYLLTLSIFCSCIHSVTEDLPLNSVKEPKDTLKILAIGNSFSADAIEHNLFELFVDSGVPVIIANLYSGGCSLEKHWNNAKGNLSDYKYTKIGRDRQVVYGVSIDDVLTDENWDYISFQQVSSLSGDYESFMPYVANLVNYVDSLCDFTPKFVWHQTWAYDNSYKSSDFSMYDYNQDQMFLSIIDASKHIMATGLFDLIIPCGTAVQNARTMAPYHLWNRDGRHIEDTYGKYLLACTWFESLSNESVLSNTYNGNCEPGSLLDVCKQASRQAVLRPYEISLR